MVRWLQRGKLNIGQPKPTNAHYVTSCLVTKSCLTLRNPMDCSTVASLPLTIPRSLPKFISMNQWCHPTISSSIALFSFCLQSFPASGSFPVSRFFISGGQSIGVSASASVLPVNIQAWSPLGWTGLILLSKGLSRVFSNTQFKSISSLALSLLYGPTLTAIHDYWKNHGSDNMDLHKYMKTQRASGIT